jgi:hypothetical protein
MPYSRPSRDGVSELRLTLDGEAQINRTIQAKKSCEAEHERAHNEFTRDEEEEGGQ